MFLAMETTYQFDIFIESDIDHVVGVNRLLILISGYSNHLHIKII